MSEWAYVVNGVVQEIHWDLPQCWQNISNFPAFCDDLEFMQKQGWYPIVDQTEPLLDTTTQCYGQASYSFDSNNNIVIKNTDILSLPVQTTDTVFQEQRFNFMQHLRNVRDTALAICDWTILPDVIVVKSSTYPTWQTDWESYRQSLRDLPQYYDDKYPDMIDQAQLVLPTPPVN